MIGQTILHYRIIEKLGAGGMGEVYKAKDLRLGRIVALKFIAPHLLTDSQVRERFLREAQAAAALDHPNICTVYEIAEADGRLFIAMAYVDGPNLSDKIKQGPLDLDEALDIAIQTGDALREAHENAIVHRDVKSSNILLTRRSQVKLVDFGLAQIEGQVRITASGTTPGTPAYESPEQAEGRRIDRRSDLWSLVVVLYEMIAGRLPFEGEYTQAVIYSILNDDPEPLTALRSGLPIEIDTVIARGLAKSPEQRYQHADDLLVELRQLKTTVEHDREGQSGPAAPPTLRSRSGAPPFRGLLAFDTKDAAIFFGRDEETATLQANLVSSRFTAVLGGSGSGKSSFVRAGLIPALLDDKRGDPAAGPWRVAICRPGNAPFVELAESLPNLTPDLTPEQQTRFSADSVAEFKRNPEALRHRVASLVPQGAHTLLVVDQFEELFTLTPRKEERLRFIDLLLDAVDIEGSRPIHVLITLRTDFYPQCWQHSQLPSRIAANQFTVGRLSRRQLREIVERPLALAGASAEKILVDALLDDAGDEPGNLPLLEHTLLQLWQERQSTTLKLSAYEQIGRLSGALENYATGIFRGLRGDSDQEVARKIFLRLTQLGEASLETRRRVKKSELLQLGPDRDKADHVLKTLADARLVAIGGAVDPKADPLVEVAHEALIREWSLLRSWLDSERDAIRVERGILQASEEWNSPRLSRDASALLRGAKLEEAEEWASEHGQDLPTAAGDFLHASIQARRRERRRRRAVLAGMALVTLFAVTFALLARHQQRLAESRELASRAMQTVGSDPVAATSLAIQAAHLAETPEALWALTSCATEQRCRLILTHTSDVGHDRKVAFSPDGSRLLITESFSPTVWDISDLKKPTLLLGFDYALFAEPSFSPDGNYLARAAMEGLVEVWDLRNKILVHRLEGSPPAVLRLAFSPDGTKLLAAGEGSRVWSLAAAGTGVDLKGHTKEVIRAEFSPDGRQIASASNDGTVKLWDSITGKVLHVLNLPRRLHLHFITYSPDGSQLATAEEPQYKGEADTDDDLRNFAVVWDTSTGQEIHRLLQQGDVRDIRYLPRQASENKLLTVDGIGSLRANVWDLGTGSKLREFPLPGRDSSWVLDVHGSDVVSAGPNGQELRVWNWRDGTGMYSLPGHEAEIVDARFSPERHLIASASDDKTVRVWSAHKWVSEMEMPLPVPARSLSYSSDGRKIVEAGDTAVYVLDERTGQTIATLRPNLRVVRAVLSPDDSRVVIWGELGSDGSNSPDNGIADQTQPYDHRVEIWDADTAQMLAEVTGLSGEARSIDFASDGRRFVLAMAVDPPAVSTPRPSSPFPIIRNGVAFVVDTETGVVLHQLSLALSQIDSAAISADGKYVLTGTSLKRNLADLTQTPLDADNSRVAILWDSESGEQIRGFKGNRAALPNRPSYSITFVDFLPDGETVVTAERYGSAAVWNQSDGTKLFNLQDEFAHQLPIYNVDLSPNGDKLVTSSFDNTAQVWSRKTGAHLLTLGGQGRSVGMALFSPDGALIATGGQDGTVRLWDANTGQELYRLQADTRPVGAIRFSQDGSKISVADGDDVIRTYPVHFRSWLELAESRLPATITVPTLAKVRSQ